MISYESYFPFGAIRDQQREAIEFALREFVTRLGQEQVTDSRRAELIFGRLLSRRLTPCRRGIFRRKWPKR